MWTIMAMGGAGGCGLSLQCCPSAQQSTGRKVLAAHNSIQSQSQQEVPAGVSWAALRHMWEMYLVSPAAIL